MKRFTLIALVILLSFTAFSANFKSLPTVIYQIDGTRIDCFASGDEYFNYLHDKNGYTIIQASDGNYYYAKKLNSELAPTKFKVGDYDPQTLGLNPFALISVEEYHSRRENFWKGLEPTKNTMKSADFKFINNVCILIRFADDTEFEQSALERYDTMFNGVTLSLSHYYNEVSYGKLDVKTYIYPKESSQTQISYQASKNRSYYKPYNATTSPDGYKTGSEKNSREWSLLRDAVNWIDENAKIPDSINIDANADGYVDNVSFIIRGQHGGWSELLWAHRFTLPSSYSAKLNGKQVSVFIFQPETQSDRQITCHEFYHALGSPDLYHYSGGGPTPVGPWDIMESGDGHMSSLMKEKYTTWLKIPTVNESGRYNLKVLTSDTLGVAIKIPLNDRLNRQFLVIEYRKKEGIYESSLPGSGLIVYRYNSTYRGNSNYNGTTSLDMLYAFRPGGTITTQGDLNRAFLHQDVNRTVLTDDTDGFNMYMSRGEETGVEIYDIYVSGDTAYFSLFIGEDFSPTKFEAASNSTTALLEWETDEDVDSVILLANNFRTIDLPTDNKKYNIGDILPYGSEVIYCGDRVEFEETNLAPGINRYYNLFSVKDNRYSKGINRNVVIENTSVDCEQISLYTDTSEIILGTIEMGSRWGYAAGHNSLNYLSYANPYEIDKKRLLTSLIVDIATVNEKSNDGFVRFWVALNEEDAHITKDNIIGDRIYWQDIKFSELRKNENRIEFKEGIFVEDNFFIGYDILYKESFQDTFALKVAKLDNAHFYVKNKREEWIKAPTFIISSSYIAIIPEYCTGIDDNTSYFMIFPSFIELNKEAGSAARISIASNKGQYDISSDIPQWLTLVEDYAADAIYIYASGNNTGADRTAVFEISVGEEKRQVTVKQKYGSVSVEDVKDINEITVYPNPSNTGIFNINLDYVARAYVIDINGKRLQEIILQEGESSIDLSQEKAGIFFLRILDNKNTSAVGKFIKLIKSN